MAEIYNRVIETPGENTSDAIILQRIRIGAKILECGCATGYMTKYMKEKLNATVWIIERNPVAFDMAKEYAEGGICADLEQADTWLTYFADIKFDYILFADVLEHLRNPAEVLRNAATLLCEDGELLASIPNVAHADILMNLYQNQWNYKPFGLLDDTHIHFWGPENVRNLFALADLAPVFMDYSIIPPFQTEQAVNRVLPEDQAVGYAICQRYGSDIYQFVVAAKRADYVLKHGVVCEDVYQQRHAAYGRIPEFCVAYEEELQKKERIRETERAQFTQLMNAHENLTAQAQELMNEKRAVEECLYKAEEKCAAITKEYESLLQERELLFTRNNALMEERQSLEHQLQQSQNAYQTISEAFFWKLTKPLRVIVDFLKYVFRNSKIAHLLWKGAKCLKQNGISYTCKKTVAYFSDEKNCGEEQMPACAVDVPFYKLGDPITILTTKHTAYVARLLQCSLARLNVSATIITEEQENYGEEMHIVICPQMFKRFPSRYVSFQMEQTVSSRWLTEQYFEALSNSYAVFDYSLVNVNYFKKHTDFGKMFYYLPVDYLPNAQRNVETYVYDVAFYGDVNNPRRRMMLDELKKEFNVRIISEVFGEELYQELSKAKIVVNLHYYENAMLETTRLYETLSLGTSIVVSERSSDPKEEERLEGIVDFTEVGDVEGMKARIAYWLSHDAERAEKLKENNSVLSTRASAFDYFFYRFLLANDWLSFNQFYELAGNFVHFKSDRVCLSLPEEVERREAFDQDNQYGFEVFPGLRHKRGWTGCGLSYKFIMKKAQEQNLDRILVCEDDVFFPDDFEERFNRCMRYLDETEDWDIFQGLMADVGSVTVSRVDRKYEQMFVSLDHMISTVFNLYDKSIYPYIIAWDETNCDVQTNTIDRALEAKDMKIVATAPFLVGHKEELSSTIWGFNNSQYNDMIASSSKKLEKLAEQFERKMADREI